MKIKRHATNMMGTHAFPGILIISHRILPSFQWVWGQRNEPIYYYPIVVASNKLTLIKVSQHWCEYKGVIRLWQYILSNSSIWKLLPWVHRWYTIWFGYWSRCSDYSSPTQIEVWACPDRTTINEALSPLRMEGKEGIPSIHELEEL